MTIGTGIALGCIWLYSAVLWHSPRVDAVASRVSTLIALALTVTARLWG